MNAEKKLFGDGLQDDTATIQEMLDRCGYVYLPSGTYLITRPLIIHSNTHFHLAQTAILKLADHANCSILDNDGLYSDIPNENVTIEGGIWDGNHDYQERQKIPNEGRPCDENEDKPCEKETYISNIYTVMMVRLIHINRLLIKNVTYKNPTSYAVQIGDVKDFKVENITFDYALTKRNMDGIHIQGPARFGYIHNIFGNANDDHVALCANGTIRSAVTRGAIEDITIDGIYCDNGYTGVRLLSRGDPVRNITVSNIHGAFRFHAVSFTHHYPLRDDMPVLIENVTLNNLFIAKSKKIDSDPLFSRFTNEPLIWFENGVNCKNIVIEKVFRDWSDRRATLPTVYRSENANVENLVVRDLYEEKPKEE